MGRQATVDLLYRIYCEGCGNVSAIHDNENAAPPVTRN